MFEHLRWKTWARRAEQAYPYADELLSNEIYVLLSAIAMNALLSFFPFMILLTSISTRFFNSWQVHTMIYEILRYYLPSNQDFIVRNVQIAASGWGTVQIVSVLILVWSVANVFIPLEMALNRAWNVQKARTFWESQTLALFMVLVSGILSFLFVAGAASTQGAISALVSTEWVRTDSALRFINIKLWMVPLTFLMFYVLFHLVPNTKVTWTEVLPAAIFTGVLWEVSNYVFALALPYLGLDDIYGAFVVSVTLLTWAYLGSVILLLGANLTARRVFANQVQKILGSQGSSATSLAAESPNTKSSDW